MSFIGDFTVESMIIPSCRYKREFGFTIPSRDVVVDDIRVRGTARACAHQPQLLPQATSEPRVEAVRMYDTYIRTYVLHHSRRAEIHCLKCLQFAVEF